MKVVFTSETKEYFRKHNDYVRKQKKSDGQIQQEIYYKDNICITLIFINKLNMFTRELQYLTNF